MDAFFEVIFFGYMDFQYGFSTFTISKSLIRRECFKAGIWGQTK
jgi:hypothetical protein